MSELLQWLFPPSWRWVMKWWIRVGVVVWLCLVVIMPVWGYLSPSKAHVAVLESFTSEPAVLISAAGGGYTCVGGVCDHSDDRSQRGYLTFPSSIFPGDITFVDLYYD